MFTSFFRPLELSPKELEKNEMVNSKKAFEVYRLPTIEWLTKDKKGTRSIRKVWKPNEDPLLICKTKWQNEINIPENENWKHISLIPN